ncbi:MAG TPA: TIGR00268 family protein, partial [Nitrosopumilaceae archaeon]|nr:TIGR00268 family protein [Nitrosopumilaceae archaeon]
GFTKEEIREYAQKVGLSVYDRPSNSCLASRIPWGQEVTVERLERIEMAEIIVKQFFGVRQVRVRDFNGVAKIEVGQKEMNLLSDQTKLSKVIEKLKQIGFTSVIVDPEGYKPGKLNVIVD